MLIGAVGVRVSDGQDASSAGHRRRCRWLGSRRSYDDGRDLQSALEEHRGGEHAANEQSGPGGELACLVRHGARSGTNPDDGLSNEWLVSGR